MKLIFGLLIRTDEINNICFDSLRSRLAIHASFTFPFYTATFLIHFALFQYQFRALFSIFSVSISYFRVSISNFRFPNFSFLIISAAVRVRRRTWHKFWLSLFQTVGEGGYKKWRPSDGLGEGGYKKWRPSDGLGTRLVVSIMASCTIHNRYYHLLHVYTGHFRYIL